MQKNLGIKQGEELLKLYHLQKQFSHLTINGRMPNDGMYYVIGDQIEILSKEIGGRAKTKIRKECKKHGISPPNFKKEGI